jgi:hypothetical protein
LEGSQAEAASGPASAAKENEEPQREKIVVAEGPFYSQIIKLK